MKGSQLRYFQPGYLQSELRQSASTEELEQALRSELADWLALGWFYPDGFEFERLRETAREFICTGSELEYIFPKQSPDPSANSLAARYRYVLSLAQNAQLLAADTVLGIKLLRWEEGELVWLEGMRSIFDTSVPRNVDEVALVVRRVPDGSRLSDVLSDEGEMSIELLDHLVTKLVGFHDVLHQHSDASYSSSYIEETIFSGLESFLDEYEQYLDVFSRVAIKEIANYLRQFVTANELLFRRRGRDGFVAASHGALRASSIVLTPLVLESDWITIVGRRGIVQDMLADVAALVVDIELYEAEYLADEIVRRYQSEMPECFDAELFRFYCVAEGLRAAIEAFSETGADRTMRANQALGHALRSVVSFPKQALLLICGTATGEAQGLAESLVELYSLSYVRIEDALDGLGAGVLTPQVTLDRFISRCEQELSEEGRVVAQWLNATTELSAEHYTQIKSWAKQQGIPYRIIRCDELETHEAKDSTKSFARNSQLMLALQIGQGLGRSSAQ